MLNQEILIYPELYHPWMWQSQDFSHHGHYDPTFLSPSTACAFPNITGFELASISETKLDRLTLYSIGYF